MVANVRIILGVFGLVCALGAQTRYDLLLKGGHVIELWKGFFCPWERTLPACSRFRD